MTERYSICGYTRISVDLEEDRDNTSIENQKAIIEDYVRRHFPGSTLDLYADRDRSGYTFSQREQYQRMRQKLMAHQYDILIVKDLSRFSRRNSYGQVELETLRDAGIRFIAIGDNVDIPTNDDWFRVQFYFLINEMPVTDTSRKVRGVIKRRQEEGRWICSVPYGYVITNTKTMTFEVDEPSAQIVRQVFDLYNSGWGYKRIANYLTAQHIPTPRAVEAARMQSRGDPCHLHPREAWNAATIYGILDNDFYIGTLRQGKYTRKKINGEDERRDEADHLVFEHNHEPIVAADVFARTRELRKNRTRTNFRGERKYRTDYSGLLFCGDCGSPMFSMSRKDLKPAYVCGAYHKRGLSGCTSHHIRMDVLDDMVRSYIGRVRETSADMTEYLQKCIREEEERDDRTDTEKAAATLEEQLRQLQAELKATKAQKIRDALRHPEDAELLDETYDALEKDLANRITGVRNQMTLNSGKAGAMRKAAHIARTVDGVFGSILQKETPDRSDLHLLLDRITVFEDRVEIALKSDVDAILRCSETPPLTLPVCQRSTNHTKCLTACAVAGNTAISPNIVCEGDPLEIYTDADGEVIFKKYSPIGELSTQTKQFAEVLNRSTNLPILIADRDRIIACAGMPKREVLDRRVSAEVEELMEKRMPYVAAVDNERIAPVDGISRHAGAIYPIIGAGDVSGAVILMLHENGSTPTQTETKLTQVAASFLGKQMEE